jgi:hypothetical protein
VIESISKSGSKKICMHTWPQSSKELISRIYPMASLDVTNIRNWWPICKSIKFSSPTGLRLMCVAAWAAKNELYWVSKTYFFRMVDTWFCLCVSSLAWWSNNVTRKVSGSELPLEQPMIFRTMSRRVYKERDAVPALTTVRDFKELTRSLSYTHKTTKLLPASSRQVKNW